jgi:hypothetical protein
VSDWRREAPIDGARVSDWRREAPIGGARVIDYCFVGGARRVLGQR